MVALGLYCCAWDFSSCGERASLCGGFSRCKAQVLGSWGFSRSMRALESGLCSCGPQLAQLLYSMWNLPGPRIELMSPALAGRLLSPVQPGKSGEKVLSYDFISIDNHYLCYQRHLEWAFLVCIFQEMCPFQPTCWPYGHKTVHNLHLLIESVMKSLFSFLIVVFVSSFFFLISLARCLSNIWWPQRISFCCIGFPPPFFFFSVFYLICLCSHIITSFLLLTLCLTCSAFLF